MKKFGIIIIAMLALASCSDDASIGIIGGADGPTTVVVASKADTLDAMPEIDGVPTPPGDFESASQSGKTTVIITENVTEVMQSEYAGLLGNKGFEVGITSADEGMTAMTLESDGFTVTLILNGGSLTTTITEK